MVLMTHQRKIKQQNSRFIAVLIQCKQTHQHRIRTHQHLTGPNHQHRTFSRRTTIPTVIMKIINAPRTPTLQVHVYRETNFFFIILIFYVSSELLSHECLLHNHFVFYMSYFAAFVAFPTSFLLSILL